MKINFGYIISKFLRWINRPALRNCTIDFQAKVGTGTNCINVKMGKYSYMGKNNSVTNTEIGKYCSIASYCSIGGGQHNLECISTSPRFQTKLPALIMNKFQDGFEVSKNVVIGNDVWIGEKVFVKDGIYIGDGAVIGAHSVVTHDVPPYAIMAGSPAKLIRYRFDEQSINYLLKIKWWNFDDEILMKLFIYKDDPKKFIQMALEEII